MSKNFIIIEPDPIVCMDLEDMLVRQYPDGQVTAGFSLRDIGPAINAYGPDTAFFIKSAVLDGDPDLARVIRAAATRGSLIVVMGKDKDFDFPAAYVELPFTSDMVLAAISPDTTPKPDETTT